MWNKESLHDLLSNKMRDYQFIVVGNREPYIHRRVNGTIQCLLPASGVATALDPIMQACGGTWVAHGSGDADRSVVNHRNRIRVPPDDPKYTLRRVWLTPEQEEGYYYGTANGCLWPLCHIAFTRPTFDSRNWQVYREVNELFAKAILDEVGSKPTFVFIQDYHFGLLPRILKSANSKLVVAQFWHIPWPNRETFRALPWKEELLDGLLANDLLGFQLRYHCQNFLDTVDRAVEAKVDHESSQVIRAGHSTLVRPFPISIDFDQHSVRAGSDSVRVEMQRWHDWLKLPKRWLGIGIDRIDYTKGIPERLRAIDLCLERNPKYRNELRFLQVGVPSRTNIKAYRCLDQEIDRLVDQINTKWQTSHWAPITYLKQHISQIELTALHRLADFCIVSSIHDGMNLVAKEYIASQCDNRGALILSRFTGAARELADALLVNPFSDDEIADAIHHALSMPHSEREGRMLRMRDAVGSNNIYRWAGKIISSLLRLDKESIPSWHCGHKNGIRLPSTPT